MLFESEWRWNISKCLNLQKTIECLWDLWWLPVCLMPLGRKGLVQVCHKHPSEWLVLLPSGRFLQAHVSEPVCRTLLLKIAHFFIHFVLIWRREFNAPGWSLLWSSACACTPTEAVTLTVKLSTSCSAEAASGYLLSGTSTAASRKVKIVGGEDEQSRSSHHPIGCDVTKKRTGILNVHGIRGLHRKIQTE